MIKRGKVFRFLRFCTVGGTVAAVDFTTIGALSLFLPPLLSVTIAYCVAAICHFLLNKFWVFQCRRNDYHRQLPQYSLVSATSWLITIGVVKLCLSTFTTNILIAKMCAVPCATFSGFVLMQLIVFKLPYPADQTGPEEDASLPPSLTR